MPICRRARSCRVWPIKGATWLRRRRFIASCERRVNSSIEVVVSPQAIRRTDDACRQRAESGVVVGHHVSAVADTRPVLLPLSDEDIYSRKAVGWEVYDAESGEKTAALLQRSVIGEQCLRGPLVLHSDNGAPMKSVTLLSKMYELGITPSRGRPRVSNDNSYSESLFRTLKYCPQWSQDVFAGLDAARAWGGGSCVGTTTSTGIAVSGSSPRVSGIEEWTIRSWPGDMSCTNEPRRKSRNAGRVEHVTGSRSAPCC